MELSKEQVEEINRGCEYGQGVFIQPFGIPDNTEGLVIYTKWQSGSKPGSCWDDEGTVNMFYENESPSGYFDVLDKVLKILKPNISFLDFNRIDTLRNSNAETVYGYYGSYTEDTIEWILLEDLIKLLSQDK